jgi:UDP-glucose 4-epimerase
VGLRLFNVYGPGQDPKSPYSGVISIFCDRLRRREPIEVFGDGSQTRDFIFINDVIMGLLGAMDARLAGASVFNICTGRGASVLELARTIGSVCGVSPDIRFGLGRSGEIRHSYGDPTAARQALRLRTCTELRAGIAETLASFD